MAERVLSDEEVAKLGLDQPAKERALSDDEVKALGLDAQAPKRVPSPTGWREPGKRQFSDDMSDMNKEQTAMWGALAAGAHGPAHALEGPAAGALSALKDDFKATAGGKPLSWDQIMKSYTGERDRIEGEQKQNLKDFPHAPIVGALLTNPGSAPTALGRLGMGAAEGVAYGIGSSEGDLTKGEVGKVGADALKGGGAGFVGAGLGELAQLPGRALARRAQKISDTTHAATQLAEEEARGGAMRSAISSNAGEHSAAAGMIKSMRDAITNPNTDPALKRAAEEFLSSAEGVQLHNQALGGNISKAYGQNARIAAAKDAMAEAISKNDPALIKQAAEAAAEAKLMDPSGVTGRLGELARRNLPPMIGGALAGGPGMAAGGVVAGAMGKPGTIMSNMLKSPSMFMPLTKGASLGVGAGEAMSKAAPPLAEWSKFIGEDEGDE